MKTLSTAEINHLTARGVTKRFGSFTALDRVDLDVRRGEFVTLLGPSGCGKTTLLRAIAGLDPQDEGTIMMGGRDVSRMPPAARDFGIVFQSYALFPNLTVAANVGYGLVNRGRGKAEIAARVDELLSMVGLADQARKYPVQLSGGQQQRVALARALATSPALLLLDEPLSALDARVRVKLRDEIKSLQRTLGVTTIMVTHDQEEALSMADRIVVMNHGVIEQVGSPAEIYGKPATAFVADFVGVMNFLDATVLEDGRLKTAAAVLRAAPHAFEAGQRVTLGVRPEDLRAGADRGTENILRLRLRSLDFLGSFCRAMLATGEADEIKLSADFSTNELGALGLSEGDALDVAIPPDAIRIYPARRA